MHGRGTHKVIAMYVLISGETGGLCMRLVPAPRETPHWKLEMNHGENIYYRKQQTLHSRLPLLSAPSSHPRARA